MNFVLFLQYSDFRPWLNIRPVIGYPVTGQMYIRLNPSIQCKVLMHERFCTCWNFFNNSLIRKKWTPLCQNHPLKVYIIFYFEIQTDRKWHRIISSFLVYIQILNNKLRWKCQASKYLLFIKSFYSITFKYSFLKMLFTLILNSL